MKRAISFILLSVITVMAVTWIELQVFWPAGWTRAGWAPIIVIPLSWTVVTVLMLIYFVRSVLPRDNLQNHPPDDRDN